MSSGGTVSIDALCNRLDKDPAATRPGETENFVHKLPGGYLRELHLQNPDERFGDDETVSRSEFHSQRYKAVTHEMFYHDFDRALVACGITLSVLGERIATLYRAPQPTSFEELLSLIETREAVTRRIETETLPAYARLRAQGYSHYDLAK
jgi:hypothetical protein